MKTDRMYTSLLLFLLDLDPPRNFGKREGDFGLLLVVMFYVGGM